MKFGKSLSNQIEETIPEWRDNFLSYKDLKKKLKQIDPKHGDRSNKRPRLAVEDCMDVGERELNAMTREEIDFIELLEAELEKFNCFFVEKEEEYVIRLKELQDRVAKSKESNEELLKIRKEIVDFHGEMVLLENYSAFNYTGLVKILKKYDKRTGALIRLPFIQRVLQQPFFTTDLIYKLVKECEIMLDRLFPANIPSVPGNVADGNEDFDLPEPNPTKNDGLLRMPSVPGNVADGNEDFDLFEPNTTKEDGLLRMPEDLAEIEHMESLYMKSTITALRGLKEIRSGSSTVSVFSLPPLQINVLEETSSKIPVLEQVAK